MDCCKSASAVRNWWLGVAGGLTVGVLTASAASAGFAPFDGRLAGALLVVPIFAALAGTLALLSGRRLAIGQAAALETGERLAGEVQERRAELAEVRAEASASQAWLRTIVDTARVGLVVIDEAHRYRYANRAYFEILNLPSADLIGQHLAEGLAMAYPDQIRPKLERAFQGERVSYELRLPPSRAGLSDRYYSVAYEPGLEGPKKIVVVTIVDITARKQEEEARVRLWGIVRSSSDAILSHSLDGIITNWNSGAEKMFGFTEAEVLGKSKRMLCPPGREGEGAAILERIRRDEAVTQFETQRVHKNGTVVDVSLAVSPMLDSEGRIVGLSTIARDITARKRIEQEREKLMALISYSRDFIATADLDGHLTFMNAAGREMIGIDPDEDLASIHITDYVPEPWRDFFIETVLPTVRERGVWEGEMQLRHRKTGALIDISRSTFFVRDAEGKPVGFATVTRNITEAKEAQKALRVKQQHSESLLRLSRNLERARSTAEILKAARAELQATLGFKVVWLYLFTEGREELRLFGLDQAEPQAPTDGMLLRVKGDAMLEEIASCRDIVIVEDAQTDPRTDKTLVKKVGNRTIVNVPMNWAGQTRGVLGTGTFGEEGVRRLSPAERQFISALAAHVAVVLDRVIAANEREAAQAAQRASEERLRLITDLVPHGIFVKDTHGRYIFANRALVEGCGMTSAEILGKDDFALVSDRAQAEGYRAADRRVLESGQPLFIPEEANTDLQGRTRYLQTTKIPFRIPETGEPALMGVWADITDRKIAEEALRRSERTLAGSERLSGNGSFDWDIRADSAICSENMYRLLDLEPSTMDCRAVENFALNAVHPEDRDRMRAAVQLALAGPKPFDVEYRIIRRDHTVRDIHARGEVVRDAAGQPMRMYGWIQDVTERKKAEAEIRDLNTDLERRVEERTAQLEAANRELESFSYSVSHDLRSPLRAMDGFSLALLEDFSAQLPEEAQGYLNRIRLGAQKMGTLIDDLLSFSRLSRSPLKRGKIDMGRIVQTVLCELAPALKDRPIEIHCADLPPCQGDPALLQQVWLNLLSNAVKYSQKCSAAVVQIGAYEENGETVYFVRDNGAGFDMRYVEKLFGVFQRLHHAEDYEGTGVGLAIVQRIVHRHGGRVWAEGAVDRGATFFFTLGASSTP